MILGYAFEILCLLKTGGLRMGTEDDRTESISVE